MAGARPKPASVDDYIAAFAPDVQAVLQRVRATVRAAEPFAGEKGNLRFPSADGIPYELIAALAALRARQDRERHARLRKRAAGSI